MLDPRQNRFDYGEQLNAPDGFSFDSAIATTYSIDLDALLAVSVALGFKDTLEGDLSGEKLLLLEAISSLKDRLIVFYQKGKIKLPLEYNYLFTLLEPCLAPVVPEGGEFSSFHPKLWLLRYVETDKKRNPEIIYRFIVLTRNLTFDKSWDVALSMDGRLEEEIQVNDNTSQWIDFILDLLNQQKDYKYKKTLKKELPYIKWSLMKNTWGEKMLPGSKAFGRPLEFIDVDSMLVMSPFIKDSGNQIGGLKWLGSQVPEHGRKLLFSRAEELNSIGEEKLSGWECFSINSLVVEGEERLNEGIEPHDLHAKVIVTERGNVSDWHLGSANATSAAIGDENHAPRNIEFMIRFSGNTNKMGVESLLEQLIDAERNGLFVRHVFEDIEYTENVETSVHLRKLIFALIEAEWLLSGSIEPSGKFTLVLNVNSDDLFDMVSRMNVKIEIDHLAIAGAKKTLSHTMEWKSVELTQISAFIPVSICMSDVEEKILLQVPVELENGDIRFNGILKKMLDSKEKILNYIRMLLDPEANKNDWLGHDHHSDRKFGNEIDIFSVNTPIFEQLMLTASRHPKTLERLNELINKL